LAEADKATLIAMMAQEAKDNRSHMNILMKNAASFKKAGKRTVFLTKLLTPRPPPEPAANHPPRGSAVDAKKPSVILKDFKANSIELHTIQLPLNRET
jgi:hypothetical protein